MYKYIISVLFLLSLLIYGCGRKAPSYREDVFELAEKESETENVAKESISDIEAEDLSEDETVCYVYVCGEVNAPGVYKLPAGSRVYEAIQLAGGLTEKADSAAVNQALFLEDGQMIQVLAQGEEGHTAEEEEDGRVDLNTADIQALMGIPGIGEAKAKSIIAYREQNGSFQSAEDVMKITGIKEGLYSRMKDYITVR
ncbi:MAG: helix-hairpin-helix domain-containing protein [Roseburia sp.]|nr:helix-hairpin-helix domain-containing protein [Roseburia sp.]